jgi:4-hydroxyproline epimerase
VVTLAHLGRIGPGDIRLETPVGIVTARLNADRSVCITNVPSYRKQPQVAIEVPGIGSVPGDIAWGGNWFFLVEKHGCELTLRNAEALTDYAWRVRKALNASGYPEVDHIELFGPPRGGGAHSRNFVLCPGKAYDRSPCGTGTSAKLACLAADGKLAEDEPWVQESIIGSRFVGRYRWQGEQIIPSISGSAHITAAGSLILNEGDPFRFGIHG